jgi:hypothetical protein|nr:MAG TPA: regulatory protein [Caudoviricetes sp.]
MNEIILQNKNGQVVVCSRDVAEKFNKRHDHVLRDVDSFKKDIPNFGEMFFQTEEPDRYGRMQRCFCGDLKNKPTQKALSGGYMEYDELVTKNGRGKSITTYKPLITGKGQTYFTEKLIKDFQKE